MVTNEFVCSSCGCVVADELLSSDHSGSFLSRTGYSDRARTGMPESLAVHHKGLSTLIGIGDTDARGKALEPSQKVKMQRLR
ncbi:MAG: transcription initiation factor IIB, partial [Nitrososphaeraceae archaeon]